MKLKLTNKELQNLLIIFFNVYASILGFSWIAIHLYFRFYVKKSTYNLEDVKNFLTIKHYILFSGFIMLHLGILIVICLQIYRSHFKKQPSKYFMNISKYITWIFDMIYWKPLEYVHDIIAPHIPGSGRFFLYLEKTWTKKQYSYKYFYCLIFIFDILPKLILAVSFFIDIVIFCQLQYFLYCIPLILIPICFSIFLKLMLTFGVKNMPIIKEYFSEINGINPIIKDGIITGYGTYEWIVKPEYETVIDDVEEMLLLLQLESIRIYILTIKEDKDKFVPYITLITSFLYLVSGIYRLFIILF